MRRIRRVLGCKHHQLQAIEIDRHSAVAAASRLRRPEARRVIGAGSAIVTTGDGIGLRSGGFGPSRNPPISALRLGALRGLLEEARRGVEDGPG